MGYFLLKDTRNAVTASCYVRSHHEAERCVSISLVIPRNIFTLSDFLFQDIPRKEFLSERVRVVDCTYCVSPVNHIHPAFPACQRNRCSLCDTSTESSGQDTCACYYLRESYRIAYEEGRGCYISLFPARSRAIRFVDKIHAGNNLSHL